MTVIDRIEELEENVFNQVISAQITSLLQDLAKQITIRAVIHNDEGAVFLFNDTVKRHNIRMDRCKLMKGNLLQTKTSLAAGVSCRRVKKTFDDVGWAIEGIRTNVNCAINDRRTMTAMTQDTREFEGAIVDESSDSGGTRKVAG